MKYEIHYTDGTVGQMILLDSSTTAEAEVAKWTDEHRAKVVAIVPVKEFTPTPGPSPEIAAAMSAVDVPADVKTIILGLAEVQSAANTKADTVDSRVASLEAEIARLKELVK